MSETKVRPLPLAHHMLLSAAHQEKAWYALRRTLPPWRFSENLEELVRVLPSYRINELIVKVDTEEFSHGHPTVEWIKAYQPRLFAIRDALATIGVVYSLNPWFTLGHGDRGRHAATTLPEIQTMVGHDGTACTCCACPLSPAWRESTRQIWTLYAQTQPRVLWVEDDIRTFNHEPVKYGCFCPLHMARFAARIGRPVTREQLVAALLASGQPHPWRAEFLDMQAEIMVETVQFLARTIHDVSPTTALGLMSSGPREHCLEGRDWTAFATTLADGQPLYSRPPLGNYSEGSLRGFYFAQDSIKLTRHVLPTSTIEQTEVENIPFTRYSKSATFTFLQMAVSFAYGSHGVTMNLFDHTGTPMEEEPWYGQMLATKKPFLEALASRSQTPGRLVGVQVLHHGRHSYAKHLDGLGRYQDLAEDGYLTMEMLESNGIPTTFDTSTVVAASGQQLRAFSDDELAGMLARGLFVDAAAAVVLCQRGFAADIGLRTIEPPVCIDDLEPLAAEEFFNSSFGGRDGQYLTLTLTPHGIRPALARADLLPGVEIISMTVDPDTRRRHPCMIAYENPRGGRVIVHLLDLVSAYGMGFNHPYRNRQLQQAIRWLSHNSCPLLVEGGVYPLSFRRDCADFTLLGLFNLSSDPWPTTTFILSDPRRVQKLEYLCADANWRASENLQWQQQDQQLIVKWNEPVSSQNPLLVTIHWQ